MVYESCIFLIEGDRSRIQLGNNTTIGSASIFAGESKTSIDIGQDCMISRQVKMNTSDFHSILEADTNKRINPPGNIFIGNHVWVGNEVIIRKDSKVSDNTVIGIRSFVNKQFSEPNIILAGVPARKLKENITWSRDKINI
jgi:acetyltransferase-like isoleucine patch superfamily enzyme